MGPSRRIVLATRNRDKVVELAALFGDIPGAEVISAADLGDLPDVVEDGITLEANALKKAREIARVTGELCVADDTGLEVDALDGAPGVHAARYAGEDATYADNCEKLLKELKGVLRERRQARFRTVMALVDPARDDWEACVEGVLEGRILHAPMGDRGFGYDPLFWVPDLSRALADISLEEKNEISHRARAAQAMREVLHTHLVGA